MRPLARRRVGHRFELNGVATGQLVVGTGQALRHRAAHLEERAADAALGAAQREALADSCETGAGQRDGVSVLQQSASCSASGNSTLWLAARAE